MNVDQQVPLPGRPLWTPSYIASWPIDALSVLQSIWILISYLLRSGYISRHFAENFITHDNFVISRLFLRFSIYGYGSGYYDIFRRFGLPGSSTVAADPIRVFDADRGIAATYTFPSHYATNI